MKFDYDELIDLGFVREDHHDEIYLNRYGYGYFVVYKVLKKKRVIAEWDDRTRQVTILKLGENEKIEAQRVVESREELLFFISLFEK